MLATVIITQNIIVSQAARQQKNNIVMCTDKDTGELITVYFDKNQTSSDLDLEDEPDAVGSSATAVCSPMPSVQEDTVETSDPESTVTKIEVTHIGKTASALTDSFITMMQFISIGTFIIFAVLSLIASWLVGSRLSKRVAKISKQVEALKPGDLDTRIAPDGSDDEIGKLIESINGMLDRLQNATEAERRFVSNASHELRTPIAAVATNLDAPTVPRPFPGRRGARHQAGARREPSRQRPRAGTAHALAHPERRHRCRGRHRPAARRFHRRRAGRGGGAGR